MATHSSVLAWRIPGTESLVGCHLWGRTESDTTEATQQQHPMDGGVWKAAVHGVARSRTRLSDFTFTFMHGEGNGNPLQCSCLENPRDGGAWWAAICGVTQSQTRLK